jgi:hypothetical protein
MLAAKEPRRTAPQPQFMDASSDSPVSCTPVAATNSSLVLTTQVTIAVHRTPVALSSSSLDPQGTHIRWSRIVSDECCSRSYVDGAKNICKTSHFARIHEHSRI